MISSSIKKASENLLRNWSTTIPTIISIAVVVSLFHVLSVVRITTRKTVEDLQKRVSITMYVRDNADPFAISSFISKIEERNDVIKPVIYRSKKEAQQNLNKSLNLNDDFLARYNFSFPASIRINPIDASAVEPIRAFLDAAGREVIDTSSNAAASKQLTDDVVTFIQQIEQSVFKTLLFFIVLFSIGSLMLLVTVIRLSFERHSTTISIMKILGAGDESILLPLIVESLLIGAISFVLHTVFTLVIPFGDLSGAAYGNLLLLEFTALTTILVSSSLLIGKFVK